MEKSCCESEQAVANDQQESGLKTDLDKIEFAELYNVFYFMQQIYSRMCPYTVINICGKQALN